MGKGKLRSDSAEPGIRQRQDPRTRARAGSAQDIKTPEVHAWILPRRDLIIGLVLVGLGLLVYWPVYRFEFVHYDDAEYVAENVRVHAGLTSANVAWAFRTFYFDNWHPLTWLSYMLDYQLFGLKPGAFHVTNVIFHCLNSLLLYGVLRNFTGARWPSAFVAAVFAVHPMHVESVAWISERKDVLSVFFGLLALWAYGRYARANSKPEYRAPKAGTSNSARASRGSTRDYFLALLFFGLGLMAKPMLVTLPFVLLLLDGWPLRRWGPASQVEAQHPKLAPLLWEKTPFFILAAVSCVLTYRAQTEALVPSSFRPLPARIANALISYGRYVGKTLWPDNLAVYYPYPAQWPAAAIAGSAVLLLAVTVLAFVLRRNRPYLLVGWLWFLGTLVPVIGLVQVGGQSMADRYMYFPMIGLLVMLAWGSSDILRKHGKETVSTIQIPGRDPNSEIPGKIARTAPAVLGGVAILVCVVLSARQVRYWVNSIALFEHTLAVTSGSTVAHDNLAAALVTRGLTNEALAHLSASLALEPSSPFAYGSRGAILLGQGKTEEAVASFQHGLQISPGNPVLNHNMGIGLSEQKKFAEAIPYFGTALRARPNWPNVHLGLGNALLAVGKVDEAIAQYNEVLHIKPDFVAAHYNLALALKDQGRLDEAATHFSKSLQATNANAYCELAVTLSHQGKIQEAFANFNEALRLDPNKAEFQFQFASFLFAQNRLDDALPHYRTAVRLDSAFAPALNDLAFILAAHDNPKIRDGSEAVRLAERACELTGQQQPAFLATLAAAYAESGQFPKAIEAAQRALNLSQTSGQKELAASNQRLLELFRASKPYRLGNL